MQNIPVYEIIIIGNSRILRSNVEVVPFSEDSDFAWITRKKNLITEKASFDNIVYLHDYFFFHTKWYSNISATNGEFDVLMCQLLLPNGKRYRDWIMWKNNGNRMDFLTYFNHCSIPYSFNHLKKYMYISGAFWMAKKAIMEKFPLDEKLYATQGEVVEWSLRIRGEANYVMCKNAIVQMLKYNPVSVKKTSALLNVVLFICQIKIIDDFFYKKRRKLKSHRQH